MSNKMIIIFGLKQFEEIYYEYLFDFYRPFKIFLLPIFILIECQTK